jgi:hypothetical protein
MTEILPGRLSGELFTECAGWIWEQMQDEGYYLAGELVELILETERRLAVHDRPHPAIASALLAEFERTGVAGRPAALDLPLLTAVLEWEDEFLGLAGIPRAES